jgi:hypothetical protein
MIMAVVLTYGVFLTLMNLAVDLAYGFLDPDPVLTMASSHRPRRRRWRSTPATFAPRTRASVGDALRRLRKNRLAMAGLMVVVVLLLLAIFADVLAPYPYTQVNFGRLNEAPSRDYPLGTDQIGPRSPLADDLRGSGLDAGRTRRAGDRGVDRRADRRAVRLRRRPHRPPAHTASST